MAIYWLLFLLIGVLASLERPRSPTDRGRAGIAWILISVALFLFIGLRWQVGGDWFAYAQIIEDVRWLNAGEAMLTGDPFFKLISWLAAKTGGGMVFVNTVSAAIILIGLSVFCLNQPRPWLALLVSFPYLIVVVAIGYVRQGIALSIIMVALTLLNRNSLFRYSVTVAAAATFHSTAALFLPLAGAIRAKRSVFALLWLSALALVALYVFRERIEGFLTNYSDEYFQSSGAYVRVFMTFVAGAVFLVFRKKFILGEFEKDLWLWLSLVAVTFPAFLFLLSSSTAVDRIGLYWLPLQLFVFSRLPDALSRDASIQRFVVFAVIAAYAATLYVWLNFSDYKIWWVPYQFRVPFTGL